VERVTSVDYLCDQYGTTEKLEIRIEAHRKYSERPDDMLDWVLDRLAPIAGDSAIDIGCRAGRVPQPSCRPRCASDPGD
jgi:hypothetical protein